METLDLAHRAKLHAVDVGSSCNKPFPRKAISQVKSIGVGWTKEGMLRPQGGQAEGAGQGER